MKVTHEQDCSLAIVVDMVLFAQLEGPMESSRASFFRKDLMISSHGAYKCEKNCSTM